MNHFKFIHTHLSLPALQAAGIRSVKWLEESFGDSSGRILEITMASDKFPVFASFGFCDEMIPILFIFELDSSGDDIIIISRQARKLFRDEIKRFYCGN
jgi:hypothetical protein